MLDASVITGWIAAVLLIFNFGTCLVMPWTKRDVEEKKPKGCEGKGCHSERLGDHHQIIAYLSIIAVIIHIIFVFID